MYSLIVLINHKIDSLLFSIIFEFLINWLTYICRLMSIKLSHFSFEKWLSNKPENYIFGIIKT